MCNWTTFAEQAEEARIIYGDFYGDDFIEDDFIDDDDDFIEDDFNGTF